MAYSDHFIATLKELKNTKSQDVLMTVNYLAERFSEEFKKPVIKAFAQRIVLGEKEFTPNVNSLMKMVKQTDKILAA